MRFIRSRIVVAAASIAEKTRQFIALDFAAQKAILTELGLARNH
jgi:hypothetical protein